MVLVHCQVFMTSGSIEDFEFAEETSTTATRNKYFSKHLQASCPTPFLLSCDIFVSVHVIKRRGLQGTQLSVITKYGLDCVPSILLSVAHAWSTNRQRDIDVQLLHAIAHGGCTNISADLSVPVFPLCAQLKRSGRHVGRSIISVMTDTWLEMAKRPMASVETDYGR